MGRGVYKNKAFALAEAMFTRHFFTLCSWTGQSTSGEPKVSLQKYQRTINVFWRIVHNCDKDYTDAANKTFLQLLMNKSKTRVLEPPKSSRKISATKNRRKGLVYKRKAKTADIEGNEVTSEENTVKERRTNELNQGTVGSESEGESEKEDIENN